MPLSLDPEGGRQPLYSLAPSLLLLPSTQGNAPPILATFQIKSGSCYPRAFAHAAPTSPYLVNSGATQIVLPLGSLPQFLEFPRPKDNTVFPQQRIWIFTVFKYTLGVDCLLSINLPNHTESTLERDDWICAQDLRGLLPRDGCSGA